MPVGGAEMFSALKLLPLMGAGSRRRLMWLALPMLVSAILELASIGFVLPLLQLFMNPDKMAQWWPDAASTVPPDQRVIVALAAFAVLFAVKSVAVFTMQWLTNSTADSILAKFTVSLFEHYIGQDYVIHISRNSNDVIHALRFKAYNAFEAVRLTLNGGLEALLATTTIVLLLWFNPMVSAIAGLGLGLSAVLIQRYLGPYYKKWGSRQLVIERAHLGTIQQAFHSIKAVKMNSAEAVFAERYRTLTLEEAALRARQQTFQFLPRSLLETVVVIIMLAVLAAMSRMDGGLANSLPILGVFAVAAIRLLPSLNRIVQIISDLRARQDVVESLVRDMDGAEPPEDGLKSSLAVPIRFQRDIQLDGVSFHYPSGDSPALDHINLKVARGQSVAFVGASGAGKSTLSEILLGLLRPGSGRLLVDGVEIDADSAPGWRVHIGYVPQQTYLIDDSLGRNIAFGVADADLDHDKMTRAIDIAQLRAVVEALPAGMDTVLGENAVRLSGGQRQRVAIARALYRDPDILVFDEATSALDNETERAVATAIQQLAGRKTLFIVAHRLSTIETCDVIVFMRDGRIEATGTFPELLRDCPAFRRMAMRDGEIDAPA